ncbi:MAG: hypothetical protein P8O69_05635 [Amylibacter sp.]|nr:hypothetical protein [Amylibacter sp.]
MQIQSAEFRDTAYLLQVVKSNFIFNVLNSKTTLFISVSISRLTNLLVGPVWIPVFVHSANLMLLGFILKMSLGMLATVSSKELHFCTKILIKKITAIMFGGYAARPVLD